MAALNDLHFMRRALELAERGLGETNPNPAVGCVLVRNGVVVGEGFHARAGSAHAEALALAAAGPKARGATAYVTLEPCAPNPRKRTPPCAPRLIEAGVRRVVVGVRDFNPSVRGRGLKLLRAAGIEVVEGICGEEAVRLNHHFNAAMKNQRPFIVLKTAMTLDGRIATAMGESKWITSTAQRRATRNLRRLFDGVIVGIETVRADDPSLLPEPVTRRPFARVVLDTHLRLKPSSRLVKSARLHPVIVVGASEAPLRRRVLEERGVVVLQAENRDGRVSLKAALSLLFARGFTSFLVEGGSEVLGSFVRQRLFDEMVIVRGPILLGGRGSLPSVGGANPRSLTDAVPMKRATLATSATLRYGFKDAAKSEAEVYSRK